MGGDFRTESGDLINNDPEALRAAREKAAELMQQAGLTDPSSLAGLGQVTLLYEENDINAKLAQLLRDTWRDQLGLVVTLKGVTGDTAMYLDEPYTVSYDEETDEFVVEGPRIEKMLGYTNIESEKGFLFFQRFLKDQGILEELEGLGIQEGDTVRMYGLSFDYYK